MIAAFTQSLELTYHWENYISIFFQIEWDMIVVTVFLSILNQMEFHLVQKLKLSPGSYPNQFEIKSKYCFLSVPQEHARKLTLKPVVCLLWIKSFSLQVVRSIHSWIPDAF